MANVWEDDRRFQAIRAAMAGRTLVGPADSFLLYQFARLAGHLPGDVAEVGVYKGGTARLLAEVLHRGGKLLHLFDTFQGMPETDPQKDWHKQGDFADTSLPPVQEYLHEFPLVRFYPGLFPATAVPVRETRFCMAHVDVDIYRSVLDCCEFFYPRMTAGGIILFDDYGKLTCPGARRAVDEFFLDKPEAVCYASSGQCFIIKL
ncbi:MAG: TylF/MycF/NovP-related O-methyltransferase [Verrucomicrobiia bacterium]|jgi:O-methyltransferase